MSEKVTSLFGGPTGVLAPSEFVIRELEELLEAARSGEVIGMVVALALHDGCSRYLIAGTIGGYSLLGSVRLAESELVAMMRGAN